MLHGASGGLREGIQDASEGLKNVSLIARAVLKAAGASQGCFARPLGVLAKLRGVQGSQDDSRKF